MSIRMLSIKTELQEKQMLEFFYKFGTQNNFLSQKEACHDGVYIIVWRLICNDCVLNMWIRIEGYLCSVTET